MRSPSGRDLTLDLQTGKAPLILHTVQNIVNPFSFFTHEMEFLDINLKALESFSPRYSQSFCWRILFAGFKNLTKKSEKKKTLVFS
jgi:hypothetical protein